MPLDGYQGDDDEDDLSSYGPYNDVLQDVEAEETVCETLCLALLPILLCNVNTTALSIMPTTGTDMVLPMLRFTSSYVKVLGIIEGEKP